MPTDYRRDGEIPVRPWAQRLHVVPCGGDRTVVVSVAADRDAPGPRASSEALLASGLQYAPSPLRTGPSQTLRPRTAQNPVHPLRLNTLSPAVSQASSDSCSVSAPPQILPRLPTGLTPAQFTACRALRGWGAVQVAGTVQMWPRRSQWSAWRRPSSATHILARGEGAVRL